MTINSLSKISAPIEDELKIFNGIFKQSMKSDIMIVNIITSYILKQKGKKLRPILVLHSANIAGGISDRSYRAATLVELLHTATLVHDDVVDQSDKRRGLPSINAIWKNKAAVLMGDYLLAQGLLTAVNGSDHDFLKTVSETVKRMSEGELLQIKKTRKLDIDEETYFRIISDKTASLIQTCCYIGAMSASENDEVREALKLFGHNLGLAFQIRDDILDYDGTSVFGKPIGGDIKEKKITLPLIYSLDQVSASEKQRIKKLIKSKKKEAVKEVIAFVQEHEGIQKAEQKALEYAAQARTSLQNFSDSPSKQSLEALVDYVIYRKK